MKSLDRDPRVVPLLGTSRLRPACALSTLLTSWVLVHTGCQRPTASIHNTGGEYNETTTPEAPDPGLIEERIKACIDALTEVEEVLKEKCSIHEKMWECVLDFFQAREKRHCTAIEVQIQSVTAITKRVIAIRNRNNVANNLFLEGELKAIVKIRELAAIYIPALIAELELGRYNEDGKSYRIFHLDDGTSIDDDLMRIAYLKEVEGHEATAEQKKLFRDALENKLAAELAWIRALRESYNKLTAAEQPASRTTAK